MKASPINKTKKINSYLLYENGTYKGTYSGQNLLAVLDAYAQSIFVPDEEKRYKNYFDMLDNLPKVTTKTVISVMRHKTEKIITIYT